MGNSGFFSYKDKSGNTLSYPQDLDDRFNSSSDGSQDYFSMINSRGPYPNYIFMEKSNSEVTDGKNYIKGWTCSGDRFLSFRNKNHYLNTQNFNIGYQRGAVINFSENTGGSLSNIITIFSDYLSVSKITENSYLAFYSENPKNSINCRIERYDKNFNYVSSFYPTTLTNFNYLIYKIENFDTTDYCFYIRVKFTIDLSFNNSSGKILIFEPKSSDIFKETIDNTVNTGRLFLDSWVEKNNPNTIITALQNSEIKVAQPISDSKTFTNETGKLFPTMGFIFEAINIPYGKGNSWSLNIKIKIYSPSAEPLYSTPVTAEYLFQNISIGNLNNVNDHVESPVYLYALLPIYSVVNIENYNIFTNNYSLNIVAEWTEYVHDTTRYLKLISIFNPPLMVRNAIRTYPKNNPDLAQSICPCACPCTCTCTCPCTCTCTDTYGG